MKLRARWQDFMHKLHLTREIISTFRKEAKAKPGLVEHYGAICNAAIRRVWRSP